MNHDAFTRLTFHFLVMSHLVMRTITRSSKLSVIRFIGHTERLRFLFTPTILSFGVNLSVP